LNPTFNNLKAEIKNLLNLKFIYQKARKFILV
jgi:hypothetical protein